MKQFYLLAALNILTATLVAQNTSNYPTNLKNHQSVVNGLLQKQAVTASQKSGFNTRVLTERVIGQSTIDNMFSNYSDSVNVGYILNGTSTYDYNLMLYPYNYPYSTSPMFNFKGVYTKPQILYNSYNHWTVNPATLVYGFYQQDSNTYDFSNNLTNNITWFADSSAMPNLIHENRFNSNNDVDTSYQNNYTGGTSTPAFKQFFTYNASNYLIKDSTYQYHLGSWYIVSKTFYLYDGSNNLIKIDQYANTQDTTFLLPLIEQFQYLNTYDGSGRLSAVVTNFWDGAGLNPYVRDTFNYTGASTFHTDWKQYQYDAINGYWAPQSFMQKNLNGAGLPDSININLFDSILNAWVPSVKQIITYNAADNPIKLDEYWYNFVTFPTTPDFETTYYYETFTNTTEAESVADKKYNFTLFPNPNNGNIQLNYTLEENAVISLFDCTGKNIKNINLLPGNNLINLNLTEISNGVYYYNVVSNQGKIVSNKFIVIK
jgi:hypothetical protein